MTFKLNAKRERALMERDKTFRVLAPMQYKVVLHVSIETRESRRVILNKKKLEQKYFETRTIREKPII